MNKKILLSIIVLALVVLSCGADNQPNVPVENDQSSTATITTEPTGNEPSGITVSLIVFKSSVADGWVNVEGALGFYNPGNEAANIDVTNIFVRSNRGYLGFLNTEEGEQYPVELHWSGAGESYPPREIILFQKIPIILFTVDSLFIPFGSFVDGYYKVNYRYPELLHPTNITISKFFTLSDGNTDITIENENIYQDSIQWAHQYDVITTGTVPVSLSFSNGIVLDIQSGWVNRSIIVYGDGEEFNTYCLNTLEKNTDITDEHRLLVNDKFDPTGRIDLIFNYSEKNSPYYPLNAIYSMVPFAPVKFRMVGPGQQKEVWLCIDISGHAPFRGPLEDQISLIEKFLNDPIYNILLSISGDGVEQLLSIPHP